jgi:SET domain-containing protein
MRACRDHTPERYIVDGGEVGNVSRYVNHSCDVRLCIFIWLLLGVINPEKDQHPRSLLAPAGTCAWAPQAACMHAWLAVPGTALHACMHPSWLVSEVHAEGAEAPLRACALHAQPNMWAQPVLAAHGERMMPDICFFASKPIAPFTELTYDYGEAYVKHRLCGDCRCGTACCRDAAA